MKQTKKFLQGWRCLSQATQGLGEVSVLVKHYLKYNPLLLKSDVKYNRVDNMLKFHLHLTINANMKTHLLSRRFSLFFNPRIFILQDCCKLMCEMVAEQSQQFTSSSPKIHNNSDKKDTNHSNEFPILQGNLACINQI